MSRFYQSGKPDFVDNFMYTPPWELAQQALAYNDAGIGKTLETASLFDNINVDYIPDPVEKAIVEKELKNYSDKADEYSTNMQLQLQNSPQSWKKYIPQLQTLGTDLSKNMKTGNLAKIQQSAAALKKWQEDNKKIKEENPELYERGLSHYINEWRKNPNRSLDATFSGDQLINFDITSKEFLDALGQFKASLQQREDGMYILNNKSVGEKEVEEAYLGLALSSPKGKAYLQQMAKFKAPGFYDEKTGEPEPLYVASDINGNQIPIEGLREQQQNWYKLSDGMKNITPFPTEHLNPRHAWTGAIEAGKKIFGFSEITKTEDPVKAKAMDRQHDFNMESVKHRNRMSEKAQDHANRMIQLERLAQIKGAQSPEGKANGEAKAAKAAEAAKNLNGGLSGGDSEAILKTGEYSELMKAVNSSDINVSTNARTALNTSIANSMKELGYNIDVRKGQVKGNTADVAVYKTISAVMNSPKISIENKDAAIKIAVEKKLTNLGYFRKTNKGNLEVTEAGYKAGIKRTKATKSESYETNLYNVANLKDSPEAYLLVGKSQEQVKREENLDNPNASSATNFLKGAISAIPTLKNKIKEAHTYQVKPFLYDLSADGQGYFETDVVENPGNYTIKDIKTGEKLSSDYKKISLTKAGKGFSGGFDVYGDDTSLLTGTIITKDNIPHNVVVVGNTENAWGEGIYSKSSNFENTVLVEKEKEKQLTRYIDEVSNRFVGQSLGNESSGAPISIYAEGKQFKVYAEKQAGSNGGAAITQYYIMDTEKNKPIGNPYASSAELAKYLLEQAKMDESEIKDLYK